MTDRLKKSLDDILCIATQAREALEKDTAPDLVQKLRDFAADEQKRADFFQVQESKALDRAATAERERDEARAEVAQVLARGRPPMHWIDRLLPWQPGEIDRAEQAAKAAGLWDGNMKAVILALRAAEEQPEPPRLTALRRERDEALAGIKEALDLIRPVLGGDPTLIGGVSCLLKDRRDALAEAERLRDSLGMTSPWPVHDVLFVLADAADRLLIEHNHDGHGHEEIRDARDAARRIVGALTGEVAPLGTAPGGYDAPIAPEQVERVETAPSWERAREAWRAADNLVFTRGVTVELRVVEACICRGERGWADAAKDTHAAIDRVEQAARDAGLWHTKHQTVLHGQTYTIHNVPTPFAQSILDLRAKTPRPDPVPADVPTGQEDQHDADLRATEPTEPTTKETP